MSLYKRFCCCWIITVIISILLWIKIWYSLRIFEISEFYWNTISWVKNIEVINTILYIVNVWRNNFCSINIVIIINIRSSKSRKIFCSSIGVTCESSWIMSYSKYIGRTVWESFVVSNWRNCKCSIISKILCSASIGCTLSVCNNDFISNPQIVGGICSDSNSGSSRTKCASCKESWITIIIIIWSSQCS